MRTIIAGSRDLWDYELLEDVIKKSGFKITCVLSGRCEGMDAMGERWAKANGVPCETYPAKWGDIDHPEARIKTNRAGNKYNAAAGPIRNELMSKKADALIAIPLDRKNGGQSGTDDMIARANAKGLKVHVFRVREDS